MIKKIIFFFLISFCSFSQSKTGEILYAVKIQTDNNIKSNSIKNILDKAAVGASYLNFLLEFNDSKAKFSLIDVMDIDDDGEVSMALSWCNYSTPIYMNSVSKKMLFYSTNRNGMFKKNEYLVSKEYTNWNILNESKMINNFLCYKAETIISSKNLRGKVVKRTTTAWFCPKIPLDFGPNGYCGLPGLILELHDRNITYGVKKISYKKTNVEIPTSKNQIDYKNYQVILRERILNQKSKLENNK